MLRRITWFLLCLLAACRPHEPAAAEHPPVILISIDTLRSDHLPAYGYRGVSTPAIDALRRDSILFRRAYSHVPLTLPSHVSILTGLLPAEHQVRNNIGFPFDAAKTPTIASRLHARGYATGAAVSSFVLRGATGLRNAFDWYDDAFATERAGMNTVARAVTFVDNQGTKPFFLFLHLYEPHAPYTPPEPFRSRYANPYDGEIAAADFAVGAFLDFLRQRGLYDRALIILLSDHGEGLGDHGEEEHGIFLYREALQVPLIVKLPHSARKGTAVDAPVQLIDVAPTIAALTGIELPGHSLLGDLAPDRSVYSETYYPRLQLGWSELTSLIAGSKHYIDAPSSELYDLHRDPGERTNILGQDRRTGASMRETLASLRRDLPTLQSIDPEAARQLAALGYVGSTRQTSGPLPDPKTAIAQLPAIRSAYAATLARDWPRAAREWRALAAASPTNIDAWRHLGEALAALGDDDGAMQAYRTAIELQHGAPSDLPFDAGALSMGMGRFDQARRYFESMLPIDPEKAHLFLGRLALRQGDVNAAEREVPLAGDSPDALLLRAETLVRRNDLQGAMAAVRSAGKRASALELTRVPRLEFIRADILARMDDPAGAEAAYRKEVELFPEDLDAWANLAVVETLQGKPAEADRVLRRMVAENPGGAAEKLAAKTRATLR